MIGDITEGREKSKILLVEDSVSQSGRPLLISILHSLCKRVEKVHYICFDREPGFVKACLQSECSSRVIFHDGTSNILGWENKQSLNVNCDLVKYLNDSKGHHASTSVAIVCDSLSPLILHRSAPYTCQTVTKLASAKIQAAEVDQVVCLLHKDLHDNHSINLLHHIATTIITVKPPKFEHFLMATHTLHKRLSGKVIKLEEHFTLNNEYVIQDITEVKSIDTSKVAMETSQPDPTANLTFNLTLTDKEKEARSQVKLPYTYDQSRQDETLTKSVGEGKIFYQPDEADDFDEEDPDDDLDI
ncbi:Elongator complex protein [Mactra antiquata]